MGGSSTKCGHGTTKSDGVCQVNDTVCGSNTQWEDATSTCIGAAQPHNQTVCGSNTQWDDATSTCIGNAQPHNQTVCGSNTQWEDATSTCIGVAQQEYCGPGTILKNGQCATIGILNPPACNYNEDCEQFLGLKPCNSSSSKECTFCPGLGKTCSIQGVNM